MEKKDKLAQMLEKNPFTGLSDLTYEYIRDEIVEMRIAPGEKVNMTQIANTLDVSRTPVRNALEQLVNDGLAEREGEKGYRAKSMDWDDCFQMYQMRKLIEGTAAYLATANITQKELEQLLACIKNSALHWEENNTEAVLEDDYMFHETIVRAARNRFLFDAYSRLMVWNRLYQHVMEDSQERYKMVKTIYKEHMAIYRALKNHFALVAKNEMESHIDHVYRAMVTHHSR